MFSASSWTFWNKTFLNSQFVAVKCIVSAGIWGMIKKYSECLTKKNLLQWKTHYH